MLKSPNVKEEQSVATNLEDLAEEDKQETGMYWQAFSKNMHGSVAGKFIFLKDFLRAFSAI